MIFSILVNNSKTALSSTASVASSDPMDGGGGVCIHLCLIAPLDVREKHRDADVDRHASGIPANPVQPRALPQPEPLLQQPGLRSRLAVSVHLLTGPSTCLSERAQLDSGSVFVSDQFALSLFFFFSV